MYRPTLLLLLIAVLLAGCRAAGAAPQPTVTIVADGLLNPVGLAQTADGAVFIAEEGSGADDRSAGVTLLANDGSYGRFISGLPSGRDSGDLSGVPLVAVTPDGQTLLLAHFNSGGLLTLDLAQHAAQLGTPYMPDSLGRRMQPLNNVRLINPFDLTFSADGRPVVSDASGNGVAIETEDGHIRFIHRFAAIATDSGPIEAVPTGIARLDDQYLVTLTGGCPYPADSGRLVAIDEQRNERIVVDGLNMPIDVAVDADGNVWLLEFARFRPGASCFSGMGYQANSGRLSRVNADGTLQLIVDGLNFPSAVLPLSADSLLISELADGELLRIDLRRSWRSRLKLPFDRRTSVQTTLRRESVELTIPSDLDAALRQVIADEQLSPYPGADVRVGDTPLAHLGQQLFFDPILSGDGNIACASCHHPNFAMADGRPLPIGVGGSGLGPQRTFLATIQTVDGAIIDNPFHGAFVPRNSPTILNSALLPVQFWDGRVDGLAGLVQTLDDEVNELALYDALATQALFPLTSVHEMAGATWGGLPPQTVRANVVARIAANDAYRAAFQDLFGSEPTLIQIAEAIAAFERRLIFSDSPWDDYIAGASDALSQRQKRGALLFFGRLQQDVNCAACHAGDLFTDLDYHDVLAPQLGPGKGDGPDRRDDWGRARVTYDSRDRYRFRTPPLRNVALTAPYLHSGAYRTLTDTLRHHADPLAAAQAYDPAAHLPPDLYSSVRPFDPRRGEQEFATMALDEEQIGDLVAFLQSLTDPAAADLTHLVLDETPSGLTLDDPTLPSVRADAGDSVNDAYSSGVQAVGGTDKTTIRFENVAAAAGLDFRHGAFRDAIYADPAAMMGGGLCWIDIEGDGWLDLYLVNSYADAERERLLAAEELPSSRLFRNRSGRFQDVTAESGSGLTIRGNGCIAADFDGDGDDDLYVTADGPNKLLWNENGRFREGAAAAGVAAAEWNSAASAADFDGDGDLDLFVGAYIDLDNKIPNPSGAFPQDYYGLTDRLYRNNGDGTFSDIAAAVGLERRERALGAVALDLNGDRRLELYIANDGQPNRLYTVASADNLYGFHFVDETRSAGVGDSGSGMGVASGDYDLDGRADLVVTNWDVELNAIYRNRSEAGKLDFRYSTYRIGMLGFGAEMTGWGTTLSDFDQDGDLDLLTVNGRVPVANFDSDAELVRLYGNLTREGRSGEFREWTAAAGLEQVGPLMARGSAVADYDNDGDLDIAINTIGGAAVLLQNVSRRAGNWLQIGGDRLLPGTTVSITLPSGETLLRRPLIGSSYLASEDPRLHIGLGTAEMVDIRITWADGGTTERIAQPANELIIINR